MKSPDSGPLPRPEAQKPKSTFFLFIPHKRRLSIRAGAPAALKDPAVSRDLYRDKGGDPTHVNHQDSDNPAFLHSHRPKDDCRHLAFIVLSYPTLAASSILSCELLNFLHHPYST